VVRIIVAVQDSPSDGPRSHSPSSRRRPSGASETGPSEHKDRLVEFYDESYAREGEQAQLYARWRALGAKGKADHVMRLCARAGVRPARILDVGCGDGALLSELHRRGFGRSLDGVEITQAAVRIAGERAEIDSVELYDGEHLEALDGAYDLGIVSHVLEHVLNPAGLLAEVGRVCGVVVMEVPLEANVSAKRTGKREHAEEVGHLQRLDRDSARAIVARAGLGIAGELEDALPLEAQRFFAQTPAQSMAAMAKWGMRSTLHLLAPPLARRLFTVHYACLCVPR
jgi:SAM-dependent methyltransferase